MTANAIVQIVVFLLVLLALVKPLGWYMARVYQDESVGLNRAFRPVERFIYRCCGVHADTEMNWKQYAFAMLMFNLLGLIAVYCLQRWQAHLPLNPNHFPAVSPALAFNTAISFVSNTNWQAYGGETTMSYLTQMLAFTVQNFVSAATGMAILVAVIRGFARRETTALGNFWVDLVRSTLYILLPLSILLAIVLNAQGVIQNFLPTQNISLLQPLTYQTSTTDAQGHTLTSNQTVMMQQLPMGPVASQVAIEELGSNGGGYFNVNAAHPYQNPTPLTNFLEMLAILLIPAALCYTFGVMIKDRRQGWAVLAAMFVLMVPLIFVAIHAEEHASPLLSHLNLDTSGGNMEGKEVRFGITNSALWTTITTAASNGSVNSMIDSYMPMGTMVPLWLMQLSEVAFGGVGSGLYGMLIMVMLTVFIAGLMVGRTPEYLGKKIEPYEMKLVAWVVLIMPLVVLTSTAYGVLNKIAVGAVGNPGTHGFTEILYAFTSMTNNNGSSMGGLNANLNIFNILGGIAMLIGRFWIAIPALAIAGSMARKKILAQNVGTLPTHNVAFVILIVCVVVIVGALTFLPALALGPIVEHLQLWGQ